MEKKQKTKLLAKIILDFYIGFCLRLGIPLAILSLALIPVYFENLKDSTTIAFILIHFGAIFLIVVSCALIIKKHGRKYFFDNLLLANLYFKNPGAKPYKMFVIVMVLIILLALVAAIGKSFL